MVTRKFKVEAVIFDMDGVITNTMPDHFQAWKSVLADEGVQVTHLDIYSREGQQGRQSVEEIFGKYKIPCSLSQAKRILNKKEKLFKKIARTRFIAGSRLLIRGLAAEKFKLALVTGTSRHEMHRILPRCIYDFFHVAVTGSDVRRGKPHPEPYLAALAKIGVSPRLAVAVENAPLGIQSAKAAGLKCLALETSLSREYLHQADYIYSSIQELAKSVTFIKPIHAH